MKMGVPVLFILCATAVVAFVSFPSNSLLTVGSQEGPVQDLVETPTADSPTQQEEKAEPEPAPTELFGKKIKSTYPVKVIRAVDGDTFEVLLPDNTHPNIRFESVDTPETGSKNVPGQPFGNRATEALKELCVGKMATVHQTGTDGYRRPVVYLIVDEVNINAEMVRLGYAWQAIDYSDDEQLAAIEAEARKAKRGLWADENPMPPWEWRRQQKEERKKRKQAQAKQAKLDGDSKTVK